MGISAQLIRFQIIIVFLRLSVENSMRIDVKRNRIVSHRFICSVNTCAMIGNHSRETFGFRSGGYRQITGNRNVVHTIHLHIIAFEFSRLFPFHRNLHFHRLYGNFGKSGFLIVPEFSEIRRFFASGFDLFRFHHRSGTRHDHFLALQKRLAVFIQEHSANLNPAGLVQRCFANQRLAVRRRDDILLKFAVAGRYRIPDFLP